MENIEHHFRFNVSRRSFFRRSGLLAASSLIAGQHALFGDLSAIRENAPVEKKESMIVRSRRYLDLEMPACLIDSWLTPVKHFYVRSHFVNAGEPRVEIENWRLKVTGEVERSLELSFADLEKFESASVVNTMECAGNGRWFYRPRVPGIQWQRGAVGNAEFAGPRLRPVLERAGLKPGAKHVALKGLDRPPGNVPEFVRSIPIEKAMHPDTLLATKMNGRPLTVEHGFPTRALVPGWLGAASVKWLAEVRVLDRPFEGPFMKPGYCLPKRPVSPEEDITPDEMAVITALPVKSIIAQPGDGARLKLGPIRIGGAAWAGEADIARVDISTDKGRTWGPARLGRNQAPYAWRLWEFRWHAQTSGAYVLMSRATDTRGRTQPAAPPWNPSGYLWNGFDRVEIHVDA